MFDTADLGRTLDKATYDKELPELRTQLLKAQQALTEVPAAAVVLLHGEAAAGQSELLNLLHEWFDARYLDTEAYEAPSEEERERPPYWRYWQWLPARGRIGLFLGSWYTRPLVLRARGKSSEDAYIGALRDAAAFEKLLADDGTLVIKFWLHISEREQARRLKARRKSPERWALKGEHHAKRHPPYERVVEAATRALRETATAQVPWTVIEAGDQRYRNIAVLRHLLEQIEARVRRKGEPHAAARPESPISDPVTILDTLDLGKSLTEAEYEDRLAAAQAKLGRLSIKLQKRRHSALFVFEGWDAAGKGGAVRRIVRAIDARQYRIIPIGPPTDEERAHHYLWRFWRHLPRRGRITIYDRSWYGRVLVERVEGFASEPEWQRAYGEINDFEQQLAESNTTIVKFWLHISHEEQLRRFKQREAEPWKQYKLTPDDFRNRERNNLYESAANDMIGKTSTDYAPWTLVEADDKKFARVKVLETLCQRLEEDL